MKIQCKKLGKQLDALEFAPYPGEFGQEILANISKPAWDMWIKHQTMLINEYRLTLIDPEARKFLQTEMRNFLFGGDSTPPPGYVEQDH